MTDGPPRNRRALLRLSALAVAGVAGCATFESGSETDTAEGEPGAADGGDASGTAEPRAPTERANASTAASDSQSGTAAETPDLDLREANVTAVEVESAGDGAYRFSVTLYHDDDGEDGYANWWQVETLDGERLGRRELLHAHSTAPFTRSATVEIPDGTACVVVRGHDETHGYGGRAMLVTVDGGATRAVDQGSEKRSLADRACP
ncbi:hypothetical protein [Halosimplex pelagicum]|uniref:Lipoprotein n=1 Tax=Halosimplex pelagicum TaxID=869886 RepID=A0A7D5P9J1_9EURY|nr:hypothetical protein [Halosimplex pelagicum]QLH84123.1 hypothetical protein HZS54_21875 [Halosimplex pelagicum]